MPDILDRASASELLRSAPVALALTGVVLEVCWLATRPGADVRRLLRSTATAAGMALGALLFGVLYSSAFRSCWDGVASVRWDAAAALWRANPILGFVATFVAWDLAGWLYHLIGHRTQLGWAAHQPHHSGVDFDLTLGLRQSWFPIHGLLLHPLLALLGFDLRVLIVCAAISNAWQLLEHTSAPVRLPPLVESLVMTPATHRHHHGRDGHRVNLGPVLTCWDRLAGSWVPPTAPLPASYGPVAPASSNPLTLELQGWRALLHGSSLRSFGPLPDPDLATGDEQGHEVDTPVTAADERHRERGHHLDSDDGEQHPAGRRRARSRSAGGGETHRDQSDPQQQCSQHCGEDQHDHLTVELDALGEHHRFPLPAR